MTDHAQKSIRLEVFRHARGEMRFIGWCQVQHDDLHYPFLNRPKVLQRLPTIYSTDALPQTSVELSYECFRFGTMQYPDRDMPPRPCVIVVDDQDPDLLPEWRPL